MEVNEEYNVDVMTISGDGKGIGKSDEGKLIIIEGVNEDDETVRIKIIKAFEMTYLAKKVSKVKTSETKKKVDADNPYDLDDDEEEDELNEEEDFEEENEV